VIKELEQLVPPAPLKEQDNEVQISIQAGDMEEEEEEEVPEYKDSSPVD
jgi:hypothetical protein